MKVYSEMTRVYVTYTLKNRATNQIYVGRASGYDNPFNVMMKRYYGHKRRAQGYSDPKIDEMGIGPIGYSAIRGREQDLIEAYGGIGGSGTWKYYKWNILVEYKEI